jgi:endonuclease/exonuclease/phosphatase family metal-dependent hydrolase
MDKPLSCRVATSRQLVFRGRALHVALWLILLLVAQLAAAASPATAINIATYNLRLNVASDGANAWPNRKGAVASLIRYHAFDIFGTQEGLPDQIDDLAAMPGFAYVGVGRDDGKRAGEHSAIFYRTARFAVEAHGDYWLSQTPDKPSKGWDATCCNRIVTWAKFRDKASGQRFFVFNVHFDHQGEIARRESALLMLKKIHEIARNERVICIGDFNSTPDTVQIKTMQTALRDAREISAEPPYGPIGTFNDFKLDAPMKERIDYIFVGAHIDVLKYAVLSDSLDGRYPSDHHPVVARIQIK